MKRISIGAIAGVVMAMVIAAPVAAQSAGPSGPASPPPGQPTAFTATIMTGGQVRTGTTERADGVVRTRGNAWAPVVLTASDPRIQGRVTISYDGDEYPGAGEDGASLSAGAVTWRITTDEGAWQGSYPTFDVGQQVSVETAVLTGEGAYEGLTIIWEQSRDWATDRWEIRGVIFPAPPPDAPTAP